MSDVIDVLPFGEEGEYLVAMGHHDLDAFRVAALKAADDFDMGHNEDSLPDGKHRWMRPILRSDCDSDETYAWRKADDWQMWTDDPTEDGAVPITIVDLEL